MAYIPLVVALASVTALIFHKVALSRQHMKLGDFVSLLFLFLFLFTVIFLPFNYKFVIQEALSSWYLFLFILMVFLAISSNYLSYQCIQKEKLSEYELIGTLGPTITILLTFAVYPKEFNITVLIVSIIAFLALFFSHLEKKHFVFDQYSLRLLFSIALASLEVMIIRQLLNVYSPVLLYTLRSGLIFIFFASYFDPDLLGSLKKNWRVVAAAGFMGSIGMILLFYGYENIGIVYSTLPLVASPLLVLLLSSIFFKEKIKFKTIFGITVILACAVYINVFG